MRFVELDGFSDEWSELGLNDDDLYALQVAIMANPAASPVIEGTGGLRKLRFAPAKWNVGKSNAARVCYVYFESYSIVLLVAAYSHKEKDNLSASEKAGIKAYIEQSETWLSRRVFR